MGEVHVAVDGINDLIIRPGTAEYLPPILGTDSLEEDGVRRTEYGLIRRLSAPFPLQEIGQTMS